MNNIQTTDRLFLLGNKGVLLHVCCHCWSSVIRSNINTLFSRIDFSLPQTVLNEILFSFFFSIRGHYPTMRAWCHSVLGGMVFVKYAFGILVNSRLNLDITTMHLYVNPCAADTCRHALKQSLICFNILTHPHIHHKHCRQLGTKL